MTFEWMDRFLLGMPGVTSDYKPEWDATRYFVGGRMFAMRGADKEGAEIFTMKHEPTYGDSLRQQYPEAVVPGYHMNKVHWNSLYLKKRLPEAAIRDMLLRSYEVVYASLPQKTQRELVV